MMPPASFSSTIACGYFGGSNTAGEWGGVKADSWGASMELVFGDVACVCAKCCHMSLWLVVHLAIPITLVIVAGKWGIVLVLIVIDAVVVFSFYSHDSSGSH